ncbi:btb poz domain-containing protein [Rutstroemia sp. NJR-2017a BBW]|nr:btb poz domain-containing protein [Rutstroemia sp. NJR-2017a BBW]
MVIRKDELERQLKDEHELIQDGVLRDESPLDDTPEFQKLCTAARLGDLKGCQEAITSGANINARDKFDYTPLILSLLLTPPANVNKASLCGHYQVVELLLESGALCERDTFQGERCLYNALNNQIRNLLLRYDYSKSTDPLQPYAAHITSLLTRQTPNTSDITLTTGSRSWNLHKMILSARSPYFQRKLSAAPETTLWKLASSIPPEAFQVAIRYLYLGEVPSDLSLNPNSSVSEEEVLTGIDKVSKQLEIESLWDGILGGGDRRIARQRYQDEVARGREQIETWYRGNVQKHKLHVDTSKAKDVKWTRDNGIFADVLLQADEDEPEESATPEEQPARKTEGPLNGIPVGPSAQSQPLPTKSSRKSVLYPCHRAMLLRSEYFQTMFSSSFQEAQDTEYLNIVYVDCSPAVLEIILDHLYVDTVNIPIDLAIDVLLAADMLFIERLKTKAAQVISTIGNGTGKLGDRTHMQEGEQEAELINPYDVMRAGWLTRVQKLEEFCARYLAYRLEDYIDEKEFEDLINESAARIEKRQETDTIELLDDIRYYLSDRFRLRFEDSGLEDMMDETAALPQEGSTADEKPDEAIDVAPIKEEIPDPTFNGQIRTLDGEIVTDEFAADAINYQVLLGKLDKLLERLKLDA